MVDHLRREGQNPNLHGRSSRATSGKPPTKIIRDQCLIQCGILQRRNPLCIVVVIVESDPLVPPVLLVGLRVCLCGVDVPKEIEVHPIVALKERSNIPPRL